MINSITSSKTTFHPIYFHEGLNVIIADKASSSTGKGSRNGLGKTTFIEILHFCLGADLIKGSRLNVAELQTWDFSIDITIKDVRLIAKRYITAPTKVFIKVEEGVNPFELLLDEEKNENFISLEKWNKFLGLNLFNIGIETNTQYPTFRSVIGFFVRREKGYDFPFAIYFKEKAAQTILNNSYVLGLDWENATKLRDIQSKIDRLLSYKQVAEDKDETQGVLKSQIITLKDIIDKNDKDLANFNVLPEYKNIQNEADTLTTDIQQLLNTNSILSKKLEAYIEATTSEKITDNDNLENLYKEAQIVLSENVKKQLVEAKKFHEEVIKNRKSFLEAEMNQIKNEITQNEQIIKEKADKKQELMQVLSSHGALDEYNKLQDLALGKKAKLKSLEEKLADLEKAEKDITRLKKDTASLKQKLKNTLDMNSQYATNIKVFFENNGSIHDKKGNLVIDFNKEGNYKFAVDMDKGASAGVQKVGVFCYDLMLIETAITYNKWGIDFLVHDSILYDPMDERQKANVIMLAAQKAKKLKFQYIMTINSDQVPYEYFKEGFDFRRAVVLTLTDENITKSLLGIEISNPNDMYEGVKIE